MGSQGVQFRGVEAVMAVYDNLKIIAWSITYGKLINMKFVGSNWSEAREALKIFLEQLENSETSSVYTLNLYEDLPKGEKIRISTEPDYSFNFILQANSDPRGLYGGRNTQINTLLDKVTKLEAQLAIREDDDEPDNSIGAILGSIFDFKDPEVVNWIRSKAIGIADKLFAGVSLPATHTNVIPMNTQSAKIGAITAEDPVLVNEEQQKKMQHAMEILARVDPNLGDNLMKLAMIAQNDPGKYTVMSKML